MVQKSSEEVTFKRRHFEEKTYHGTNLSVLLFICFTMGSLVSLCKGYGQTSSTDYELEETLKTGNVFYDKIYDSKISNFLLKIQERRQKKLNRYARAVTTSKASPWPEGIVPFIMEDTYTGLYRRMMHQAMRHWENTTCLQFVEKEPHHKNYVLFRQKNCACSSQIGNQEKGQQYSTISEDCCGFSNVVHELGHIVGFYHEHQRPDRDKYITIITQNIRPGAELNFQKLAQRDIGTMSVQYDFESIMHYHRKAFASVSGIDTIVPRKGYESHHLERKNRLSEGDTAHAKKLYKCPTCGQSLLAAAKRFESPATTSQAMQCEWRILASHGEKISLKILSLKMFSSHACETDYLKVIDGYSPNAKVIGKFCGSKAPDKALISTGNRMLLIYKTSTGHQDFKGFRANYKTICGGNIKQETGVLESPHFPFYYKPSKDCTWDITVKEGYRAVLDFTLFQMKWSFECKADHLEIIDPQTSKKLARLCGNLTVGRVTSDSNKMKIRFVSDSIKKELKGFSATFKSVVCGGNLYKEKGQLEYPQFPAGYQSARQCDWNISVAFNHHIVLNFLYNGNSSFDCNHGYVEVWDGVHRTAPHKHLCGAQLAQNFTSYHNQIRVRYVMRKADQSRKYLADFKQVKSSYGRNTPYLYWKRG